jgi:peptide/nickel transport system permease protein
MTTANLARPVGVAEPRAAKSRSELLQSWRRFRANRAAVVSLVFLALVCAMALLANVLVPYDPTYSYPGMRGIGPSWEHPLGFDHIGRDLLARVVYGARVALMVGLGATVISVALGVLVGAVSGYFGSIVDTVLSRLVDTLMAFPLLALLIVLAAVLGPSLTTTITVIGATTWARFARVVRADVMAVRQSDYVTAARACGVKDYRIIFRHVLPNVLGPVIVLATLGVGGIIILESALSFLGLGIQPPTPSWGGTLADGRALIRQFPHIIIFPGVMIFLTVLAFNLLGDGLRDALDPRQRS